MHSGEVSQFYFDLYRFAIWRNENARNIDGSWLPGA